MMPDDILDRLRRLGVTKGARNLRPAADSSVQDTSVKLPDQRAASRLTLEQQFASGSLHRGDEGACFVVDHVYRADHFHGQAPLADLLERNGQSFAVYCGDDRLSDLNLKDFVFLDTETTGLHGANTLAFLVGIAFFNEDLSGDTFVVRQFFLRDHDDEIAMLQILAEFLGERAGLVTFNGRTFDLSILQNRYLYNRLPANLQQIPHIDLLPLSRRLWRQRLGSVALGNLESTLLGVRRTEEDVPGWLIPTIYNDYLRSQDARELRRIFYHNEIDLLSMVTLTSRLLDQLERVPKEDNPVDLFSLAKWQADIGQTVDAEELLKHIVQDDLPLSIYHQALEKLGWLLKRQGRYEEALPYWKQWAATSTEGVDAFVEIAKYYEWQVKDYAAAEKWTAEAIRLIETRRDLYATLARDELLHRQSRLRGKLAD